MAAAGLNLLTLLEMIRGGRSFDCAPFVPLAQDDTL